MESASPEQEIRNEAIELSRLRREPCLLLLSPRIEGGTVRRVCEALNEHHGGCLSVILASPGGYACAAYGVTRELRRRFQHLTVYVPVVAKSAATILCIAADELVLGELGELGPLDPQVEEKQMADYPRERSCLERLKALDQLRKSAMATFEDAIQLVLDKSGMRPLDACTIAADFTSKVYAPLYSQIDPGALGEDAREVELAIQYADRVLRRYRPELHAVNGSAIVQRLVRDYPAHCFVIDLEELGELGLPARPPDEAERIHVERIASALVGFKGEITELVFGEEKAGG